MIIIYCVRTSSTLRSTDGQAILLASIKILLDTLRRRSDRTVRDGCCLLGALASPHRPDVATAYFILRY